MPPPFPAAQLTDWNDIVATFYKYICNGKYQNRQVTTAVHSKNIMILSLFFFYHSVNIVGTTDMGKQHFEK